VVLDDRRGTALDGDHTFARFNPALGLTLDVASAVQLYAEASVSHRAPTPVELTCADPDAPCRLPNGFQADPPLDPAVARTLAGGFRGTVEAGGLGAVHWNLGVFRTRVADDLYFVSAGPFRNSGYFRNLDATRRQGVEVSLRGEGGPVGWSASYAFLDATFREAFRLSSPAHPEADGGEVSVERGDGLPLVPRHLAKASLDAAVAERLAFGGALVVSSSRYLRGDEANLLDPLGGYAVLDLHGRYHVRSGWAVSVHLTNALGADYVTAGLLGEPDEVEAFEGFEDPRFLTPGAPRAVRLGVEYAL
jgi:outer membrane receptor protein involved in Fe transport